MDLALTPATSFSILVFIKVFSYFVILLSYFVISFSPHHLITLIPTNLKTPEDSGLSSTPIDAREGSSRQGC
jgi:hypothetical protein